MYVCHIQQLTSMVKNSSESILQLKLHLHYKRSTNERKQMRGNYDPLHVTVFKTGFSGELHCMLHIFISKGQQEMHARSRNVEKIGQSCQALIVLLCPPVAQGVSAAERHFIITTFRLLIFHRRGVGHTDRLHVCTLGSDFYRHFHGTPKICPAFAAVIVDCGRFFIHSSIMDAFAPVSHSQLMDDSCGIHSLHHLQKLHFIFSLSPPPPPQGL